MRFSILGRLCCYRLAHMSVQLLTASYWLLAGQRNMSLPAKCVPHLKNSGTVLLTASKGITRPSGTLFKEEGLTRFAQR